MVTYEIQGRKSNLIRFFSTVKDQNFDLRLLKDNNFDYYSSSEALKIISELFEEPLTSDSLRVLVFPYFDRRQEGMMWIVITKRDEYTLHVEREDSPEVEQKRGLTLKNIQRSLFRR